MPQKRPSPHREAVVGMLCEQGRELIMATARIAIIHEQWITNESVGADEIAVLAILALHANKERRCFPSQGLIADLLKRSRAWVSRVISRLVDAGIVEKTHRRRSDGGRSSCLYRLIEGAKSSDSAPCSEGETPYAPTQTITVKIKQQGAPCESPLTSPDEDWQPTNQALLWALDRFPTADLQALTERFVNRCIAKGYRYRDLSAAWRSWLADDLLTGNKANRSGGHSRQAVGQTRFDAWACVANRSTGSGLYSYR